MTQDHRDAHRWNPWETEKFRDRLVHADGDDARYELLASHRCPQPYLALSDSISTWEKENCSDSSYFKRQDALTIREEGRSRRYLCSTAFIKSLEGMM